MENPLGFLIVILAVALGVMFYSLFLQKAAAARQAKNMHSVQSFWHRPPSRSPALGLTIVPGASWDLIGAETGAIVLFAMLPWTVSVQSRPSPYHCIRWNLGRTGGTGQLFHGLQCSQVTFAHLAGITLLRN
jgi:hypothetical protein